jgi:hypothetical protein
MISIDNISTFLPRCGRYDLFEFLNDLWDLWNKARIESVVSDYRAVDIFYLNQSEYDTQVELLSDSGLFFVPLSRVKSSDSFGHEHKRVEKIGQDTTIFGVVGKDVEVLKRFKQYDAEGNDFKKGLMLGYPECCCRAFSDFFRRGLYDPIYEIAQSTPGSKQDGNCIELDVPWMIQAHLRYFEARIIPFFPCSFSCDAAQDVAEDWYKILNKIDPKTLKTLENLMKQKSVWDIYNSQVLINGPPFEGDFMGYVTSAYYPEKKIVKFSPSDINVK